MLLFIVIFQLLNPTWIDRIVCWAPTFSDLQGGIVPAAPGGLRGAKITLFPDDRGSWLVFVLSSVGNDSREIVFDLRISCEWVAHRVDGRFTWSGILSYLPASGLKFGYAGNTKSSSKCSSRRTWSPWEYDLEICLLGLLPLGSWFVSLFRLASEFLRGIFLYFLFKSKTTPCWVHCWATGREKQYVGWATLARGAVNSGTYGCLWWQRINGIRYDYRIPIAKTIPGFICCFS